MSRFTVVLKGQYLLHRARPESSQSQQTLQVILLNSFNPSLRSASLWNEKHQGMRFSCRSLDLLFQMLALKFSRKMQREEKQAFPPNVLRVAFREDMRAFSWAIITCFWCYLGLGVCWYDSYVFLCNLLVSALHERLSAGCISEATTPTRRPVERHSTLWHHEPSRLDWNSGTAVFSWQLFSNATVWTLWPKCMQVGWNTPITDGATQYLAPTSLTLGMPSTQSRLRCFDEPPDDIFTLDNLFPAGCSTQMIHRQSQEIHKNPHKTRNRKQYAP